MLSLTIFNFLLLVLAHFNTWRPISFKRLGWLREKYTHFIEVSIAAIVTVKFMAHTGQMPDVNTIMKAIYGDGPPESVRVCYRMNWMSFFLYQIIVWLFALLSGS